MIDHDDVPPGTWRWLGGSILLLLVGTMVGIALISAGVFDPKPVGELTGRRVPGARLIEAGSQEIIWLDQALPDGNYSLKLTAGYREGEVDVGYGLVVGSDDAFVALALSPLGYLSLWEGEVDSCPADPCNGDRSLRVTKEIIPWRRWPHVKGDTQSNEIWFDVRDNQLSSIRINGELLAAEPMSVPEGKVGLWAQSFGEAATFDFLDLQFYSETTD